MIKTSSLLRRLLLWAVIASVSLTCGCVDPYAECPESIRAVARQKGKNADRINDYAWTIVDGHGHWRPLFSTSDYYTLLLDMLESPIHETRSSVALHIRSASFAGDKYSRLIDAYIDAGREQEVLDVLYSSWHVEEPDTRGRLGMAAAWLAVRRCQYVARERPSEWGGYTGDYDLPAAMREGGMDSQMLRLGDARFNETHGEAERLLAKGRERNLPALPPSAPWPTTPFPPAPLFADDEQDGRAPQMEGRGR